MNRILSLLIIVIIVIIFTAGGVWFGISYQMQKDVYQIKESQNINPVIKALSSKVIVSPIIARGEVVKIEDKNITLKNKGETLTIVTGSNSKIQDPFKVVDLNISDIKIGDNLQITSKLLQNGQLEGQLIFIIPLASVK